MKKSKAALEVFSGIFLFLQIATFLVASLAALGTLTCAGLPRNDPLSGATGMWLVIAIICFGASYCCHRIRRKLAEKKKSPIQSD